MVYGLKGVAMEHKQYKKDELEVGMEVAVPYHIYYGWQTQFRYAIWAKEKITALTPKKTKITLSGGRVIETKKNYGYRTYLYKYDSSMPKETEVAQAFKSILINFKEMQNIRFSDLGDEEMIEAASNIREILELASGRNTDDKSECSN